MNQKKIKLILELNETKETLATIGKVVERPECTPIRDDKGYLSLKRLLKKIFQFI